MTGGAWRVKEGVGVKGEGGSEAYSVPLKSWEWPWDEATYFMLACLLLLLASRTTHINPMDDLAFAVAQVGHMTLYW